VDSNALHKPKRLRRRPQRRGGGSLTIIGTALVDTGSRMDEVIFEEFKGTGNSEIVLDRKLMEKRIFPCLDITLRHAQGGAAHGRQAAQTASGSPQLLHPLNVIDSMEFLLTRCGAPRQQGVPRLDEPLSASPEVAQELLGDRAAPHPAAIELVAVGAP